MLASLIGAQELMGAHVQRKDNGTRGVVRALGFAPPELFTLLIMLEDGRLTTVDHAEVVVVDPVIDASA